MRFMNTYDIDEAAARYGPFACEVRPTDKPADFTINNRRPKARP